MREREASTYLLNLLKNDAEFVSKLSTYRASSKSTIPMLIFAPILPSDWKITDKTCNIYTVSNASRLEYNRFRFRASCRSNTYSESRDMALALMDAVNRHCESGYFVTTTVLQTTNPSDAAVDNFNTPVEILVRAT